MALAEGRNVHQNVISFESAGNCSCQAHHVPPRYFPEATSPFSDEETFCVVRDPLDKVLSQFKMKESDHPERADYESDAFHAGTVASPRPHRHAPARGSGP